MSTDRSPTALEDVVAHFDALDAETSAELEAVARELHAQFFEAQPGIEKLCWSLEPIEVWTSDYDEDTFAQPARLARLTFVFEGERYEEFPFRDASDGPEQPRPIGQAPEAVAAQRQALERALDAVAVHRQLLERTIEVWVHLFGIYHYVEIDRESLCMIRYDPTQAPVSSSYAVGFSDDDDIPF